MVFPSVEYKIQFSEQFFPNGFKNTLVNSNDLDDQVSKSIFPNSSC
jgi:hypothetical protein